MTLLAIIFIYFCIGLINMSARELMGILPDIENPIASLGYILFWPVSFIMDIYKRINKKP